MLEPHDHDRDDDLRPDPYIEVSWSGRIKKRRRKPRRSDPASNANWVSATDQFTGHTSAPPQQPAPQQMPPQAAPQHAPPHQPATQQQPPQRFTERAGLQRSRPSPTKARMLFLLIGLAAFLLINVTNWFARSSTIPDRPLPTPAPTSALLGHRAEEHVAIDFIDLELGEAGVVHTKEVAVTSISDDVSQWYDVSDNQARNGKYLTFEVEVTNTEDFQTTLYENLGWSDGTAYLGDHVTYMCRLTPLDGAQTSSLLKIDAGETVRARYCVDIPESPAIPGYIWIDVFDEVFRWEVPWDALN